MKSVLASIVVMTAVVVTAASTQNAPPATGTDIYHVMFTKAAPGQAAELAKVLVTPDTTAPMPEHFIVLRHQEGDDWDYVVIHHLGPKAEVVGTPPATPNPARPFTAWHNDTFAAGPGWGEFSKQMAIGGSAGSSSPVYVTGVHRAVAGHREQLQAALTAAGGASAKIESGNVLLQHIEGADWNFMTLTRYNSWQDLGSDRTGVSSASASTPGGWADIRQHSAFHRDTIADRIFPAK